VQIDVIRRGGTASKLALGAVGSIKYAEGSSSKEEISAAGGHPAGWYSQQACFWGSWKYQARERVIQCGRNQRSWRSSGGVVQPAGLLSRELAVVSAVKWTLESGHVKSSFESIKLKVDMDLEWLSKRIIQTI